MVYQGQNLLIFISIVAFYSIVLLKRLCKKRTAATYNETAVSFLHQRKVKNTESVVLSAVDRHGDIPGIQMRTLTDEQVVKRHIFLITDRGNGSIGRPFDILHITQLLA